MIELSRTIRFCLNDAPSALPGRHNTFSAWPAMEGLGRYYELEVICRGEVDPRTGYFLNIKRIDEAVREHVLPELAQQVRAGGTGSQAALGELMRQIVRQLRAPLDGAVARVMLHLTPRYRLEIGSDAMDEVVIRQQFEFSAAHRLHVPERSEAENRELFGKCNNPAGHGHNYQLEVAVRVPIGGRGEVLPVAKLDRAVDEAVIDRLDHTHLNHDVPEFEDLNPSVENLAKVIWQMLERPVADLVPGAAMEEVCVRETQKTMCCYRGA
ncbi:MAG: 6-carboxytetrahydropterin synthase [Phycisphaeraceae bacterium]